MVHDIHQQNSYLSPVDICNDVPRKEAQLW